MQGEVSLTMVCGVLEAVHLGWRGAARSNGRLQPGNVLHRLPDRHHLERKQVEESDSNSVSTEFMACHRGADPS